MTTRAQQFAALKEKHPDAVLLFPSGDFYIMYNEDAEEGRKILGLNKKKHNKVNDQCLYAIAAFPHHALDTYLPRLIRAGKRVVICDQLEQTYKKNIK